MDTAFQQNYLAARRSLIEQDFAFLNPAQREAVLTTEGPLLLLAGAGSGKTTVLINRIVNLIRYGAAFESDFVPECASEAELSLLREAAQDGTPEETLRRARAAAAVEPVEPWRILAITFTNKAADELKSRLARALGPEGADVWASTFHSACVRILRRDAARLGFTNSFTIYDTSDCQSVVKKILRDFDLDEKLYPYRYVLSVISSAKDEMLTPEAFLEQTAHTTDARRRKVGEIYQEYARRLKDADAMDFDDLILNAVRLLQANEDVRSFYQRKFRYVLVDEYQDTNNLQYLLTSLLAGGYENICVVGDDDQSIYKFRGATIRNILEFEEQYKGARVIRLEQNYRSTGHILDAANGVIANNRARKGKRLWTEKDAGEKPLLHVAPNENEEAQFVADQILEDFSHGTPWGDHAVLYRMNAQSNQLERAFQRRGIPYRVFGGMKFFDRAEIKDMLAYLTVIANPTDDLRLTRIINNPPRGIGPTSVEKAAELAREAGTPLFEVVKNAGDYPELQRTAVRLRQFAALIEALREQSETEPLDSLYDMVTERSGYIRMLQEKDTPENAARLENIHELKSNILSFIKETGDSSLRGFLDEVALYTDLDKLDADADSVVLMTIHAAKGLEFPVVFLVGVEDGIFPSARAIGEPEEMEEERRLCYVAITRAMRRLYITCARQRMLFGRTSTNEVSRFVREIPEEHLARDPAPAYGQSGAATWKGRAVGAGQAASRPERRPQRVRPIVTPATASAPPPAFQIGDAVEHKSFGRGSVAAMTPMGGDFLVEIEFETSGRKRLMLRAAAKLMKKL
ncbi:MAG: UvrD-helicase domain-containing protein [Oscillospiraceae bacterium]|nr:UvrD-helicase domain-containing protein [Oscillospiraceae bacterium]